IRIILAVGDADEGLLERFTIATRDADIAVDVTMGNCLINKLAEKFYSARFGNVYFIGRPLLPFRMK
ncbi:Hypothetical protein FKW44_012460, partial [Caligus rogercresseyi]